MKRIYYWIIAVIILITPLGLLADGTAWGEWGVDDLTKDLGYVPAGIDRASDWWHAFFQDYSVSQLGDMSHADSIGYIISAIVGSLVIYGVMTVLGKMIARRDGKEYPQTNRLAK